MAVTKITIDQFHELTATYPVVDVRSPGEYLHAHIPGAYSLPLFSDDERKVVGTAYKQQSKQIAIKTGLKYFGGKMVWIIEEAEKIVETHNQKVPQESGQKTVIVHCWRGGMRSAGIAWLLDLYGFKVHTLVGGYKSFRRWCTAQFNKEYSFKILGGYTGSGKTEVLKELFLKGNKTIDLESLASHRGSAFGSLGQHAQPSQEMFENKFALALSASETENCIWLEDESQRIGSVSIPTNLYNYIQTQPLYFLEIPFEQRLKHIVNSYGIFKKEELTDPIIRIKKRLGGLETKTALGYFEAGDIYNCFKILLKYYDKYYLQCLQKKGKAMFIKNISLNSTNAAINAEALLSMEIAEQTIVSKSLGN